MASYPAKPWSDGQQYEIVPGETFEYDAATATWVHLTKATLDSDFQVDKAALIAADSALDVRLTTAEGNITTAQGDISTLQSDVSTAQSDITTLQGSITTLSGMSDSETARIQQNIISINTAFSMLDSDGFNLQALRTDLESEIAATNVDVSTIAARLDSDETVIQSLQTQVSSNDADITTLQSDVSTAQADIVTNTNAISNLPMPVISAVQPTGVTGQLWVNTNNGKLYYWNDSDAFITIVPV